MKTRFPLPVATGLASALPLALGLALLALATRPADAPQVVPAAAPAPAIRLDGYYNRRTDKLQVNVTEPDGRRRKLLYRGTVRDDPRNPDVRTFSGPAEELAADPAPPPVPPAPPPDAGAAALLAATNRARLAAGLPALAADPRLDRAARGWAARCAERGKLDHFEGASTPWTRIKDAGVAYRSASENAAWGQEDGAEAVRDWVSERPPGITGHRDNVLDRRWTHAGSGMARDRAGRAYWVQDYAAE